jgi:hypothetical protein
VTLAAEKKWTDVVQWGSCAREGLGFGLVANVGGGIVTKFLHVYDFLLAAWL